MANYGYYDLRVHQLLGQTREAVRRSAELIQQSKKLLEQSARLRIDHGKPPRSARANRALMPLKPIG